MTAHVFVYTMTNDSCFAPSITENYLTLACCKGAVVSGYSMRHQVGKKFSEAKTSDKGDSVWVIGVAGKDLINAGKHNGLIKKGESFWCHPVYTAKITECVQIEEYYNRSNSRFSAQKDWNAYEYIDGKFVSQEGVNEHHNMPKQRKQDTLKESPVLVSGKESFHYFGRSLFDNSIFPNNFLDTITDPFRNGSRGNRRPLEFINDDLYKILENYSDNGWRNQGIDENDDAYKKRVNR